MATFFMFGKYTVEAVQKITTDRTKKAVDIIKKCGGEVKDIFALLGEHDLIFIADFPGHKEALKASLSICRSTGISFITAPAITVQEFDKLAADL